MQFATITIQLLLIFNLVFIKNAQSKVSRRQTDTDDDSSGFDDNENDYDDPAESDTWSWVFTFKVIPGLQDRPYLQALLTADSFLGRVNNCLEPFELVVKYDEKDWEKNFFVQVVESPFKVLDNKTLFTTVTKCASEAYQYMGAIYNFERQFYFKRVKNIDQITPGRPCQPTEFSCRYGLCIPQDQFCDDKEDCYDGFDEQVCDDYWAFSVESDDDDFRSSLKSMNTLEKLNECFNDRDFQIEMHIHPYTDDAYFYISSVLDHSPFTIFEQTFICANKVLKKNTSNLDEQFRFNKVKYGQHPSYDACRSDQFDCGYGQCIPASKRCDGTPHCFSKTDENCEEVTVQCQSHEYTCYNQRQCVGRGKVCDGTAHCDDKSDELNCDNRCPATTYQCDGKKCVESIQMCDGVADCEDGSDEDSCPDPVVDCREEEFECKIQRQCINGYLTCDSRQDCLDGSDEWDCDDAVVSVTRSLPAAPAVHGCRPDQFVCHTDASCIASELRCNYYPDCKDGSDERDCPAAVPAPCSPPDMYFRCLNGQCIHISQQCDKQFQCVDHSDEENCDVVPTHSGTSRSAPVLCDGPSVFRCNNGLCLARDQQCNRVNECGDESDEAFCDVRVSPSKTSIRIGGEARLECRTHPSLQKSVTWSRKDNQRLPQHWAYVDNSLWIRQAEPSDSGEYVCSVGAYSSSSIVQIEDIQTSWPVSHPLTKEDAFYSNCSSSPRSFQCASGQCILRDYYCDGDYDCKDRSDEMNCETPSMCEPDEFKCERRCISMLWVCDGDMDCGANDRSDESECDKSLTSSGCRKDQFACRLGGVCIPLGFQCDKTADCMDGSDEIGCIAPTVRFLNPLEVKGRTNEKVVLSCEAKGVGAPVIVWRLNWGQIHGPPRVTVESERVTPYRRGSEMVVVKSVLTIHSLTLEDEGAYSCQGMNNAGEVFAIPDVIIYVEPSSVCQPPMFNKHAVHRGDCINCWCSGVTDKCDSSDLYYAPETISGNVFVNPQVAVPQVSPPYTFPYTLNRLQNFDKRNLLSSYGGYFTFVFFHIFYSPSFAPGPHPVLQIQGKGKTINAFIDVIPPSNTSFPIRIRLTESNWFYDIQRRQPVSRNDFMEILSDVEGMNIIHGFTEYFNTLSITDIKLWIATSENYGLGRADLVEVCKCPEGYTGSSCQMCDQNYQRNNYGQCVSICACNNHSNICYESSGNTVCQGCLHHTTGVHCEMCAPGYIGDATGGSPYDCQPCDCPGSSDGGLSSCHYVQSGQIQCSECSPHSFGPRCEKCHYGYFYRNGYCLPESEKGCRPGQFLTEQDQCVNCFCFGSVTECSPVTHARAFINSSFGVSSQEFDGFTVVLNKGVLESEIIKINPGPKYGMIHINTPRREDAYWILPSKFYTYPLSLYKGALRYTASYYSSYPFHYGKPDVILRAEDTSQFLYYTYPDNTFPVDTPKEFVIPLYEAGWVDAQNNPVSRDTFLGVLKNLQSIWVRAKFSTGVDVEVRLSAVSVEYSVRDYEVELGQNGYPILEKCHCLPGYQGQWCEDCQPGYRKTVDDMHYVHCEPIEDIQCDPRTGHCQGCPHNTVGRNCECPHGFYMDRANNCEPCLCPVDASIDGREKVSCSLSSVGTLVCHNCPVGSTGSRCERCLFDYEGDPSIYGGRCVPTSDVPRPPVIETSDGDQKIDDKSFGDTINMDCLVRSSGNVNIMWSRSGGQEITRDRSQIFPNNTLQIRDLQKDDEGLYVCTAANSYGSNTKQYLITFYTDAEAELEIRFNPTSPEEGKAFGLDCIVKNAVSVENVEWSREGGELDRNAVVAYGSTLFFHSLQVSDSGRYKCTANTLFGPVSKLVKVNVKPKTVTETLVEVGKSITVDCVVSPNTYPAKVYWLKNGDPNLGPRTAVLANHTLHIYDFTREDEGIYACVVVNRDGSTKAFSSQFTLLEDEREKNAVTIFVGQKLQAKCYKDPYETVYFVEWTKDGNNQLGDRVYIDANNDLEISKIQVEDSGSYTCKVMYVSGQSTESIIYVNVQSVHKPSVNVEQERLLLNVGDRMILTCRIDCEVPFVYKWTKNGQEIRDSRIQLDENQKTLFINSISYEDRGMYVCEAENEYGRDQKMVNVEVLSQPAVIDLAPQYDIKVGDTLTLRCQVDGPQTYQLQWLKDNNVISSPRVFVSGNELTVSNIQNEDGGIYTCRFYDQLGSLYFDQKTEVLVRNPLAPKIKHQIVGHPILNVNDHTTLNCVVDSEFPFEVQWFKDDVLLDFPFVQSDNKFTLALKNVQPKDSGRYVCRAFNEYGSVDHTINIEVKAEEAKTENELREGRHTFIEQPVRKSARVGESVTLTCSVRLPEKDMQNVQFQWTDRNGNMFDDERLTDDTYGNLMITDVKLEDEGVYVCSSYLNEDRDVAESYLSVRGGENGPKFEYADTNVAVSINPDSQTALIGSRVAITCDVKSDVPFTPVITWRNAHANNLPPNHQTIGNQLIFNNVNEEHGGLYQCTVNTPVGTVSAYSSLTVLRNDQDYERDSQPAIETVDLNGGTKTIYTGQSIYLRCRHPENNYHVRIRLESPNDEILSEGYGEVFYLLSEVTPQNSGRYTCVIDDLSIRLFVYITVEEIAYNPSESTLYIHPKSVYQIKESKVDLNCYGDENVSDYRWFKLSKNQAWLPVNLKDVFVIENSLQISNFQPEHAGLYKCTAINRVDGRQLEANVMLNITDYPYLLVSPDQIEMFEGDSVTFNCQSSDDFELMYWSREDNRPLPENSSVINNGKLLILENLQMDQAGKYICTAMTVLGTVNTTASLIVHPLSEERIINTRFKDAYTGDSVEMDCFGGSC